MNELEQVVPWVNAVGVPGLLAVGLFALHKGWVVTGREHQQAAEESRQRRQEELQRYGELKVERDEWKAAALRHLNVAERAVDTAARAAGENAAAAAAASFPAPAKEPAPSRAAGGGS